MNNSRQNRDPFGPYGFGGSGNRKAAWGCVAVLAVITGVFVLLAVGFTLLAFTIFVTSGGYR